MLEKRKYRIPLEPTEAQTVFFREKLRLRDGETAELNYRGIAVNKTSIHIPDVGEIKHSHPSNPVAGEIKAVRLHSSYHNYQADIVCEYRSLPDLPLAEDHGIQTKGNGCALAETGEMVVDEEYQADGLEKLHQYQKELAAIPCGSKDWHRQKTKTARLQKRLQEQRDKDYQRLLTEKQEQAAIYIGFAPAVAIAERLSCGKKV